MACGDDECVWQSSSLRQPPEYSRHHAAFSVAEKCRGKCLKHVGLYFFERREGPQPSLASSFFPQPPSFFLPPNRKVTCAVGGGRRQTTRRSYDVDNFRTHPSASHLFIFLASYVSAPHPFSFQIRFKNVFPMKVDAVPTEPFWAAKMLRQI